VTETRFFSSFKTLSLDRAVPVTRFKQAEHSITLHSNTLDAYTSTTLLPRTLPARSTLALLTITITRTRNENLHTLLGTCVHDLAFQSHQQKQQSRALCGKLHHSPNTSPLHRSIHDSTARTQKDPFHHTTCTIETKRTGELTRRTP
jgi:hypothetical protein